MVASEYSARRRPVRPLFVRLAPALGAAALGVGALVPAASGRVADSGLALSVSTTTVPVSNLAASQTPATVGCPGGSTLVGGGLRTYSTATISPSDPYHPINGLVLRGLGSSDAGGTLSGSGVSDPTTWTAYAGFAGQNEPNDAVTAFAMCATGGPAHTTIVSVTANGPAAAQSTVTVVATCPSGTRLVGGGAMTNPSSEPSIKPDGSYPSNAAGAREGVTADPDSWAAVGEAGGLMSQAGGSGTGGITTTALAICSTDPSLHTSVVMAGSIDHPAGPGNGNPGSDAISTVTATCPGGTTLLDGGALATGDAPGDDGGNVQQGVHLRGSYPSQADASAVGDGATNPSSWSAIVQSGGQQTPGTDSFAYALCAQAPPAGSSSPGTGGGGGGSSGGGTGGSDTGAGGGGSSGGPGGVLTPPTVAGVTTEAPKSATARHGKRGSFAIGSGPNAVTLRWTASGLGPGSVVLTAASAPSLVTGSGGAAAGAIAIAVSAKGSGRKLTSFTTPLDIAFPGAAGNIVPAWSADGKSWTAIPRLSSTVLAGGYGDGYYRDAVGTLHVLTLHPAIFALLRTGTKLGRPLTLGLEVPARLDLSGAKTIALTARPSLASSLTVTLTAGARTVVAWRAPAKGGATELHELLPARARKPGRYTLVVRASTPKATATFTAPILFVRSRSGV